MIFGPMVMHDKGLGHCNLSLHSSIYQPVHLPSL